VGPVRSAQSKNMMMTDNAFDFFTGVVLEKLECSGITKMLICQLPSGAMFPRLERAIAQSCHPKKWVERSAGLKPRPSRTALC
jgi:hypothetical protein